MRLLEAIKDTYNGFVTLREQRDRAIEAADILENEAVRLQENLVEIQLSVEDAGWSELRGAGENSWNFPRQTLRKMMDLSRKMYILNPLYRRAIEVQALYVWALGMSQKADNEEVQKVIDACYDDDKNQAVLTSQPKYSDAERDQQMLGNQYIAVFINRSTGAVRLRLLPVDEITDIISNPEDVSECWYYKRQFMVDGKERILLYADLVNRSSDDYGDSYQGQPVQEDCYVLHTKTGSLGCMKFGMPEYYSTINYAISYKTMLEQYATILRAYARMAMKVTGMGKGKIAGKKSQLQTGVNGRSGQILDNNPPTNTAGFFLAQGGADISAIKTAGATTPAKEASPLRDMVAAGAGIPSHFFGDADMGNFATSTTLDRPTELKMVSRQRLWANTHETLNEKLILFSAKAENGILNKAGFTVEQYEDLFDEVTRERVIAPSGVSMFVEIKFPSILERNVTERVRAVTMAATLNGSKAEGIIPDRKLVARLLLEALDIRDVEKVLALLYPNEVLQGFVDPAKELEIEQQKAKAAETTAQTSKMMADKPAPAPTGNPKPTSNRS